MANQSRSEIIKQNPIGNGLEAFRASYRSVCDSKSIPYALDTLDQLDHKDVQSLALNLLFALQTLRAPCLLRSSGRGKDLFGDLLRLTSAVYSDDFDLDRVTPLLKAALADHLDDVLIWDRVYNAVTESTPPPRQSTPPPRPIASSLQQTPWRRNTSSFVNTSEFRIQVDDILREELCPMYIGLPDFYKTYFGDVLNLEAASKTFFEEDCLKGSTPLFGDGWIGWPKEAKEDDVLSWFAGFIEKLAAFAESYDSAPPYKRRSLARPHKPIPGSVRKRKIDIGFVDDPQARKDSRCHWSQILVPGELKSNPSGDIPSKAQSDLARYAREVFSAQCTRRFVLGFTLCGSLMRVWVFDRLGGIASERFDINKDGRQFVFTILGFLWMSEEQLGFDPTIVTANSQQFIEIKRDGTTERLILDELMRPARCIAGRATICWKAHREGDPYNPLVVKDSWQYPERDEEGELLLEATVKGVVHVARHYYHETVRVRNVDDDVRNNVRKGLDITKATNYRQNRSRALPSRSKAGSSHAGQSSSITGVKRSSGQIGAPLPPSKRPCSSSLTKAGSDALSNRVHRRVILSDWGIPIYKAGSREALLAALVDCIEGHESLRQKAGLLHRDISIGNLMISKDNSGFLIDLDLAIKEQRLSVSGAKGKTGTRAFMAIGALLGEQHSFMHDLESFFWVLFWICIHYDGPRQRDPIAEYDKWNYADTEELAKWKIGEVADEEFFRSTTEVYFSEYYRPLAPWVNRLRRVVFPNKERWKKEDSGLYTRMKEILGEARKALADR